MSEQAVRAGTEEDIRARGCVVVPVAGTPVAVFAVDGAFRAVDNRCPHMGFPLSQGTVHDGVLTCHWHHARFEMAIILDFNDLPYYLVISALKRIPS